MQEPVVKLGIYQHFKGKHCEVLGFAKHTETEEDLVIYKKLDEEAQERMARPLSSFIEEVEREGVRVPRFKWIKSA